MQPTLEFRHTLASIRLIGLKGIKVNDSDKYQQSLWNNINDLEIPPYGCMTPHIKQVALMALM